MKIAPKVIGKSLELTEQASEVFAKAARKTQGKIRDVAERLDDVLVPEMVTPEGISIKPPRKSPLERIDEPKKIVTIDEQGNPSGIRFRDDYQNHIVKRDFSKLSQKDGVSGAHNLKEFEQFDISVNTTLTKHSIKVSSKIPHPTVKGIYNIEYQMPKLNSKLQAIGWRLDSGKPFIKTVYDPAIISDKQILQWGREAFADAMQKNPAISRTNTNLKWEGFASNGLRFEGRIDTKGSEAVRTFYPKF